MGELSYEIIRKKFPDVFCVDNLRKAYRRNQDNLSMSFVDFLMYAEDYFLLKYAGKLSKTAWWLFSLLRHLTRYDGFVKLSYKDIMKYFRYENNSTISKPTFFKYVDELESFGIVRRLHTGKLFNEQYQNDKNTYIVIGSVAEIVDICQQVTDRESFHELVSGNFEHSAKKKKTKKTDDKTDKEWYDEIMAYYDEIRDAISDFFEFLATKNKSGRIALSRQVKILRFIYERDSYLDDVEYAIEQTIKRGICSEKYFFKVLKNVSEEQSDKNKDISPIQKKYMDKSQPSKSQDTGLTEEQFEALRDDLADNCIYIDYITEIRQKFSNPNNDYERRIKRISEAYEAKYRIHGRYSDVCNRRREFLESQGIYEERRYDRKMNCVLLWRYKSSYDYVPIDVMRGIKRKHRDLFDVYKYEYPDGSIYHGQL